MGWAFRSERDSSVQDKTIRLGKDAATVGAQEENQRGGDEV